MTNGTHVITLKGQDYPITLPGFAEREDVAMSWHEAAGKPRRQGWALMAGLGLAVPTLDAPGHQAFEGHGFDVCVYGRSVYNALMGAGHTREELMAAAVVVIDVLCASLFPREPEVDTAANFTDAAEAAPT
jgi:hypothetical protein